MTRLEQQRLRRDDEIAVDGCCHGEGNLQRQERAVCIWHLRFSRVVVVEQITVLFLWICNTTIVGCLRRPTLSRDCLACL